MKSSITHTHKYHYQCLKGYFLQDDDATEPVGFDYVKENLGLIDREYESDKVHGRDVKGFDGSCISTVDNGEARAEAAGEEEVKANTPRMVQWQRFGRFVKHLNRQAAQEVPEGSRYVVLYMGRHGEGYHNVAERMYGTKEWDSYWSKLDGNGTIEWADARLTEVGIQQAEVANRFWKEALKRGIPPPQKYYVSPLDRCLQTGRISFEGLDLPAGKEFRPVVKELLREVIGIHTCDRRSSKSVIETRYKSTTTTSLLTFESEFTEQDELWSPTVRESLADQNARLRTFLDSVFDEIKHDGEVLGSDKIAFLSFTAHSGTIKALLSVLGHRPFQLETGGVIPVLVKVTEVEKNTSGEGA